MQGPHAHGYVLVVDHQRRARDALVAALEVEGYDVRCAENGAQGLVALLRNRRPDAIVLDLSMPVMTGWELLEHLHDDWQLRDIPVVVHSDMRAPSGFTHVDKPAPMSEVLATLDRVCHR